MTAFNFNSPPSRARQAAEENGRRIAAVKTKQQVELDGIETCIAVDGCGRNDKRDQRAAYLRSQLAGPAPATNAGQAHVARPAGHEPPFKVVGVLYAGDGEGF